MARRAPAEAVLPAVPTGRVLLGTFRTAAQVCCVVAIAIGAVLLYLKTEQFLITDSRFILPGPPEPGVASEFFRIENTHFASEDQITAVFSRDFGRSLYLCPIAERRRRLLAIDWIRDASVLRIWPNRLVVRVTERKPVAFVQVPGVTNASTFELIDADGVLLDPQHAVKLALPVLSGIPSTDSLEKRGDRVRRFLRLQTELGPMMDNISEIDVSDVDNIRVTQLFEGRALTLMLGNQKFHDRMQSFVDNYPEIRRRIPDASVLDLRLKDRITVPAAAPELSAPAKHHGGAAKR